MKKIVLTGGGTAGHVTPNIALIPYLKQEGYEIHYIGSIDGIERKLIEENNIPYYPISSGKLRRYFDVKNFSDPFKVLKGVGQAAHIIRKVKPNVIFSKGGFVSVPVIIGGWMNRVPSIIHESDMTPGLANKLAIPFCTKICTTFPETIKYLPQNKAVHTGAPIRSNIFNGSKFKGYELTKLDDHKPVIMMMGGSLGSVKINNVLRKALPKLLKKYQVVHICGKGHLDKSLLSSKGYVQYEYVKDELPHIFAMCDMIISRAGSNSLSEILALKKPNILIPLSARASRGDQILNANSYKKQGYSFVLKEEEMTVDTLFKAVENVDINKRKYEETMAKSNAGNGIESVLGLIKEL